MYTMMVPGPVTYEKFRPNSSTTILQIAAISTATLLAPLFQLNWQSSDLSSSASQQPQATSSATFMLPSPSQNSAISPVQNGALSPGAKIAFGLALPLGLLVIVILTACVWLRRRRQKRVSTVDPAELDNSRSNINHDIEVEGTQLPRELGIEENLRQQHELVGGEVPMNRSPIEILDELSFEALKQKKPSMTPRRSA